MAEQGRTMRWQLGAEDLGQRLDQLLTERLEDYSRTAIKRLFTDGRVLLDGRVAKAGEKPKRPAELCLLEVEGASDRGDEPPVGHELGAEVEALFAQVRVIYEDDAILVLYKPRGLVVHPAAGHSGDTLVDYLQQNWPGQLSLLGGEDRAGIVHRIDKDTTGLLLAVKDARAHQRLAQDLAEHAVQRHYLALVYGQPDALRGCIDAPLARSLKDRKRMCVAAGGREARTHFRLVERLRGMSLLDVELETGRTHQIRCHMEYIRHPLVGDPVYAPGRPNYGLAGQALHAYRLDFCHPLTGEGLSFRAAAPEDFVTVYLRQGGQLRSLDQYWEEHEC